VFCAGIETRILFVSSVDVKEELQVRQMKIVFLTQYFPPEIGAAPNRISQLVSRFIVRGHDVTVLTAMPNYPVGKTYPGYGGFVRRETQDGARIIRCYIYPTQKANYLSRLTNYFSFVLSSALIGIALLPRADYLVVESPPLFLGITGFLLSRLKRMRLIFNVSDLWPESAVRLGLVSSRGFAYRVSEWLERFCYEHAWLVSGQSRSILSSIVERFRGIPTYHLSNGVDVDRFSATRRTERARAFLNGDGRCVALYAGLHGIAQGLDQVLEAAQKLNCDGCTIVLIGEGPEKGALVERARQQHLTNVKFFDPVQATEIPALVASADIVLVVLKMHIPGAVPSKLYEAMASGRPVILVADAEAAEIVRSHNTGIVVEPGDIAGLAEAIQRLAASPTLREELGANGRRTAEQFYDRAKIANDFVNHLEACLGE
jgi:colanic acid biosynthesis glycosyl transferase WcaI